MVYQCEIPGWCAAHKLCGVTAHTIKRINLDTEKQKALLQYASALVVSVNVEEVGVIEWLKANKFKRGPIIRNWANHDGRKTMLYFLQITEKEHRK